MPYEIIFSEQARDDMRALPAFVRKKIYAVIESHLKHEPKKVSKTSIKRLREFLKPQFRLRVEGFRLFYDVDDSLHEILIHAVIPKDLTNEWLDKNGEL